MNQATQNLSLQGEAGVLEALLDEPAEGVVQGLSLIHI